MEIQLTQVNDYGMELWELRAAHFVQPGLSCAVSCVSEGRKKGKDSVLPGHNQTGSTEKWNRCLSGMHEVHGCI